MMKNERTPSCERDDKTHNIPIFQGRFILQKLLGKGGFGEVYLGVQVSTGEKVAVKVERNTGNNSFLFHEARVMQEIQMKPTSDGVSAIATLKYFGQEGANRMLIMTAHGPSLENLHEKAHRFSLKTTAMLAYQMLSRLESVHAAGYLHRDLKPDNFLVGRGKHERRLFLIDFGLSSRYLDSENKHHEMKTSKSFVGTSRYASMRTHQGYSQSRRDDIEQLVYVMVYLYRGRLPWSGLRIANRDEKERKIAQMKAEMNPLQICSNCPRQFTDLLFYARNMSFTEEPEYEMCRVLIKSILGELQPPSELDYEFDWVTGRPPQPLTPTPEAIPVSITHVDGRNDVVINNGPVITSQAKAVGMFSGFGSNAFSQDIMSLGDKN